MRECMQQVADLLKTKAPCIWIDSYEEEEVIKELRNVVLETKGLNKMKIKVWSHTEGVYDLPMSDLERQQDADESMMQIAKLLKAIGRAQKETSSNASSSLWVMRDLHLLNDNHAVKRQIRDIKEYPGSSVNYNPIIVVSPFTCIASEHEKLFTIVHYETPNAKEIEECLNNLIGTMEKANASKHKDNPFAIPTAAEKERLIRACMGLTVMELNQVLMRSLAKYRALRIESVNDEKIQMVEKAGVLDYKVATASFDDIGGNDAFKSWFFDEVADAFSEEARNFGVPAPKGYLALGIPGTSKTLLSEAVANYFGVPLLSLNMSKIMGSLVGQSEKKIAQAFHVVKAVAPCVLLLDEMEKMLGGIKSSNSSDAGTTSRVVETVLKFLNEDHGVFIVATSNDISQLPTELTRAGRFDTKWYFGIPNVEERKEIFKIHFAKLDRPLDADLLDFATEYAKNYTGAEIREVARAALRIAYSRYRKDGQRELTKGDIQSSIDGVIPLFRSAQSSILQLEAYAEGSTRFASKTPAKRSTLFNDAADNALLSDLKNII